MTTMRVRVPELITADWLLSIGACDEDRTAFGDEWPQGAALTPANAARAAALGLDLDWFADRVLDFDHVDAYRAAGKESRAACSSAMREWKAGLVGRDAVDAAWDAHFQAKAAALASILCPEMFA